MPARPTASGACSCRRPADAAASQSAAAAAAVASQRSCGVAERRPPRSAALLRTRARARCLWRPQIQEWRPRCRDTGLAARSSAPHRTWRLGPTCFLSLLAASSASGLFKELRKRLRELLEGHLSNRRPPDRPRQRVRCSSVTMAQKAADQNQHEPNEPTQCTGATTCFCGKPVRAFNGFVTNHAHCCGRCVLLVHACARAPTTSKQTQQPAGAGSPSSGKPRLANTRALQGCLTCRPFLGGVIGWVRMEVGCLSGCLSRSKKRACVQHAHQEERYVRMRLVLHATQSACVGVQVLHAQWRKHQREAGERRAHARTCGRG